MTANSNNVVKLGPVERVVASLVTLFITSMLGWLVITTNQNTTNIALIQQDITYIKQDIENFATTENFGDLKRRIEKLEDKL